MLWKQILYVASGGAAGSVLRFLCQRYLSSVFQHPFPAGTFFVNLSGCLLIGLLAGIFPGKNPGAADMRLLLMTGFCGGFTTFSAFGLEGLQLIQQQRFMIFFLYFAASILLGLAATFTGIWIATR